MEYSPTDSVYYVWINKRRYVFSDMMEAVGFAIYWKGLLTRNGLLIEDYDKLPF